MIRVWGGPWALQAGGRGRKAIRWVNNKRSRAFIIYSLVLITFVYVVFGIVLAITQAEWRASDTFSMTAGCIFFVIGTSLAVAHEIRQEDQANIMSAQGTMMSTQGRILDEVKELAGKTYEHLSQDIENLPARPKEVEDIKPTNMQDEGNAAAVTVPQAEQMPSAILPGKVSELAELEDPSPIEVAWESLRLYEGSEEEQKNVLQRFALEAAIEARADTAAVQDLLKRTQVFTLGHPAGDTSVPGHGTESDLLHFTIDEGQGKERVFMPLFTRFDVMKDALLRNPDWQQLSVLETNGGDLIANRDKDVALVVNPWSRRLEWQLPPTGE